MSYHLEAWDGDRSERLDNVMCVCPNDHARLALGVYVWRSGALNGWNGTEWSPVALAMDKHLAPSLGAPMSLAVPS